MVPKCIRQRGFEPYRRIFERPGPPSVYDEQYHFKELIMRRYYCLISIVLLVAITCPTFGKRVRAPKDVDQARAKPVAQANNALAVDLYQQFAGEEGNMFFSSYSIQQAFGLCWGGAAGNTAAQMAEALHFDDMPDGAPHLGAAALNAKFNAKGVPYQLAVANALWPQNKFHFEKDYLKLGTQKYKAELRPMDFVGAPEPSRKTINQWVEDQTQGKIKDLLPQGVITPLTRLVLTNAIYFKGDWAKQFDKKQTKDQPFHVTKDQQTTVPLMHRTANIAYGEFENGALQAVSLPYKGDALSMVVLLPKKKHNLAAIEKKLTAEKLAQWTNVRGRPKVHLFLPRFKIESSFSLNATMIALGMKDAFSMRDADFSGMTGSRDLFISDAVHKAFVEVNEEGTEAAAATGIVMSLRSAARPAPPKVFRADHPFMFVIRDNATGTILFMGRVAKPGK